MKNNSQEKYCRKKEESEFTWKKSTLENRRKTKKPLKIGDRK
jgi:hypothetical protein